MSELPAKTESAYNADELGQYQAVSLSAVFALLLGLISPLAFLSPILVMIPVLGTIVSLVALSKLRVAGGGLIGARLARIGLILAIVFGVACFARIAVVNVLVNRDRAVRQAIISTSSTTISEEPSDKAAAE